MVNLIVIIILGVGIYDICLIFPNLYAIQKHKNGKHYCNKCMISYLTAEEKFYAYCPYCSNELDFAINNYEDRKERDVIEHEICKDVALESEELIVNLNVAKALNNRYKKAINILFEHSYMTYSVKNYDTYDDYIKYLESNDFKFLPEYHLSQEDFNILKEVLENDK